MQLFNEWNSDSEELSGRAGVLGYASTAVGTMLSLEGELNWVNGMKSGRGCGKLKDASAIKQPLEENAKCSNSNVKRRINK